MRYSLTCLVLTLIASASNLTAAFPEMKAGTFAENSAALKAVRNLPDNRSFALVTLKAPTLLDVEQLSARQASQAPTWFGEGLVRLGPDAASLRRCCNEDHAALRAFFDELVAASPSMGVESFEIRAVIHDAETRSRRNLLLEATDRRLAELVNGHEGVCLALIAPKAPEALAAAGDGDSAVLEVRVYKLPAAYRDLLPANHPQRKLVVRTFAMDDGNYLAQQAAELTVYGSVYGYKSSPHALTVVASWGCGVEYSVRTGRLQISIARLGEQAAMPVSAEVAGTLSAEYSLATDEERFPELIEQRRQAKLAAEAEVRRLEDEKQEEIRANRQVHYAKAQERREQQLADNEPRAAKWRTIGVTVYLLSLLPPLALLFGTITVLHKTWRVDLSRTGLLVRGLVPVLWLGFFLGTACRVFGSKPALETWFPAWLLSGLGGLVAMLLSPEFRKSFKRSEKEKLSEAVADGIAMAGHGTAMYLLWPIMRFIVMPVVLGGIMCPILWILAMFRSSAVVIERYKSRVDLIGEPSADEDTPA